MSDVDMLSAVQETALREASDWYEEMLSPDSPPLTPERHQRFRVWIREKENQQAIRAVIKQAMLCEHIRAARQSWGHRAADAVLDVLAAVHFALYRHPLTRWVFTLTR